MHVQNNLLFSLIVTSCLTLSGSATADDYFYQQSPFAPIYNQIGLSSEQLNLALLLDLNRRGGGGGDFSGGFGGGSHHSSGVGGSHFSGGSHHPVGAGGHHPGAAGGHHPSGIGHHPSAISASHRPPTPGTPSRPNYPQNGAGLESLGILGEILTGMYPGCYPSSYPNRPGNNYAACPYPGLGYYPNRPNPYRPNPYRPSAQRPFYIKDTILIDPNFLLGFVSDPYLENQASPHNYYYPYQ